MRIIVLCCAVLYTILSCTDIFSVYECLVFFISKWNETLNMCAASCILFFFSSRSFVNLFLYSLHFAFIYSLLLVNCKFDSKIIASLFLYILFLFSFFFYKFIYSYIDFTFFFMFCCCCCCCVAFNVVPQILFCFFGFDSVCRTLFRLLCFVLLLVVVDVN